MRRNLFALFLLIVLAVGTGAVAALAQGAPIGVQPTQPASPPPGGPASPPVRTTPAIFDSSSANFPYNFTFADRIYGVGFKDGEHVTVQVANVTVAPAQTTARRDGSFTVDMTYVWNFCTANGQRAPAPVFTATGDQGTTATYTRAAAPCPMLMVASPSMPLVPPNPAAIGSPGSGNVVGVATVLPASTAGTAPQQPTPVQGTPHLVPVTADGFGFVPGERVTVRQESTSYFRAEQPVTTYADPQGRFELSLLAYVPPLCSGPHFSPRMIAIGDQGTSVMGPVVYRERIMVMCRASGPQPGTPVPPGNPQPPDSSQGPAPAPPSLSSSAPLTSADVAPALSVQFHPVVAHPGATERATVQTGAAGTVTLTVMYPGHHRVRVSARAPRAGSLSFGWQTPAGTTRGTARVTLKLAPAQASLQGSFQVR